MTELELIFTLKCILNTLLMKNNLKKSITYNIQFDCCIAYLLVLLCPWRIFCLRFKPCYWIFFNCCAASLGNTLATFAITPHIGGKTISKGRFCIAVKILSTTSAVVRAREPEKVSAAWALSFCHFCKSCTTTSCQF